MSRKLFTEEEDQFLIENYSTLSNTELECIFGGRHSRKQIKWRAKSLKLKKVPSTMARINANKVGTWSEEEKEIIRKYFPRESADGVAKRLGRSPAAVRHRAYRMGVHLDYDVFCANRTNDPAHHTEDAKRKMSLARKGVKKTKEHSKKIGDAQRGERHWNWQGGKSFLPYPKTFNDKLRKRIKKRDFHQCVLCDSKKRLIIHHIDETKENCEDNNLITLCMSCHNKYHFTKDKAQQQMMREFFLEHTGRSS